MWQLHFPLNKGKREQAYSGPREWTCPQRNVSNKFRLLYILAHSVGGAYYLWLWWGNYSLAPDCSRLQFSPNIQPVKYNAMDPIFIAFRSLPTNICQEGTSATKSRCKRLQNPGRKQKFLPASLLTYTLKSKCFKLIW